jgi:SAM-dependent methyltransferase
MKMSEMSLLSKHADAFGPMLAEYSARWDRYRAAGPDRTLDPNDKENVLSEEWQVSHYFGTGADALRIVVKSLIAAELPPPAKILDLPCGSGRVLRHLRAMFPEATIGASDLYRDHVDFCVRQFAAVPVPSKEDLSQLDAGTWDVIFCGSLLTHLPESLFWPTVDFMIRSLTPGGVAVITLEGRRTLFIQDALWKLISDDKFAFVREGYAAKGFGYCDYNQQFREQNFNAQESYGVAVVRSDWLMAGLMKRDDVTVLDFCEADWDEHQDVLVLHKRPVSFRD